MPKGMDRTDRESACAHLGTASLSSLQHIYRLTGRVRRWERKGRAQKKGMEENERVSGRSALLSVAQSLRGGNKFTLTLTDTNDSVCCER